MRRREFIAALASAAAWPMVARAQLPREVAAVGLLFNGSFEEADYLLDPLRAGLVATGYLEGRNLSFEYRWTNGHNERLPALAAELIDHRPAVMIAIAGAAPALAAKR